MNDEFCKGIEDLLGLFEESLSTSEILYAKLTAQISTGITKERLKMNMTQTDFAQHMDTTQPMVSRWESGDCNFSIKKLAEIAALLDLDVNITMLDRTTSNVRNEYCGSNDYTKTIRYLPDFLSAEIESKTYNSKNYGESISSSIKEEYIYAPIC